MNHVIRRYPLTEKSESKSQSMKGSQIMIKHERTQVDQHRVYCYESFGYMTKADKHYEL